MRGWILLGLLGVVLVSPGAVAGDIPDDADDSRTCVSYMPGVLSVNPATCARAVTATAQWVINETPETTSD